MKLNNEFWHRCYAIHSTVKSFQFVVVVFYVWYFSTFIDTHAHIRSDDSVGWIQTEKTTNDATRSGSNTVSIFRTAI